ncbi:hypothetical protein CIWKM_05_01440 [Citrobacter werkmanii NBRC 105721]|nr:hypothetical protein CIWKM_05_01440 [Citrobacter werkmanii NBRC 105721]
MADGVEYLLTFTVNGKKPDANGNVTISTGTTAAVTDVRLGTVISTNLIFRNPGRRFWGHRKDCICPHMADSDLT